MDAAARQGGHSSTVVILGPDNERVEGHWSELFTEDLRRLRPEISDDR